LKKLAHFNSKLLEQLISIPGASGDEGRIRDFILDYVEQHKKNWKSNPTIYSGEGFQDALILVFGEPKTAIFAHIDTIGFTAGYDRNLIKIGSPTIIDGTKLVGSDRLGEIETELMIIEGEDGESSLKYVYDREIDRGTNLTFKPDFRLTEEYVQSPYIDNRLGVLNALNAAAHIENGAIVFSTYEESGGGSVGFLGSFLYKKYNLCQALISDITWVTEGVEHGKGVAISMRDSGLPRKSYLNRIIKLAREKKIHFQLEVESAGGSDGTMLQKTDLPFDWCFIGAPEDHVHSPDEKVFISDIEDMMDLYIVLMNNDF
jgi:putative aminopeptidase FrvX